MGTSTQSIGAFFSERGLMLTPGLSSSQVRSAVIAPQGMTVSLFAVAICGPFGAGGSRSTGAIADHTCM